jgi:hypothetical protein
LVVFRGLDEELHEARRKADVWSCEVIQAGQGGVTGLALDAPPTPVVVSADSALVRADRVIPADHCGVAKDGSNNYRERTPLGVVIHFLQANYDDVIATWSAGNDCTPPHYVIKKDGEITQLVAEKYMAQHAGPHGNPTMIGIEHDGWDGDPANITEDMYLSSAALVRDICSRNGIDVDRAHIIGHDEVQNSPHGDPGGYWDWDYYMALVRWDVITQATKPLRTVIDTVGMALPASGAWHEEDRDSGKASWRADRVKMGPFPRNSYGARYLWADADAGAPEDDAVVFQFTVPQSGVWGVSGWWPVLPGANPSTRIDITTTSSEPAWQSASSVMNQGELWLRSRKTEALPHSPSWCPLPAFDLVQNDVITVSVKRRSDARGRVYADAFKFMKT